LESNKLGGFGELPDLRRLPCFDFRWAHKLHLSFVFYLSLEASIAFTRGWFLLLVASPPAQDLLLRANYLFVPAMMASASTGGRSTLRFDESQSPTKVE
jgi:hypothetical protein